MNILLLGSQHGNELLGEKLYAHIQTHFPKLLPHVTFKIANPRAHADGKRYIESDMNRSYDPQLTTYESTQAVLIKSYIDDNNFDVVLDLHTTTCIQPPCFIVEDTYDENRAYLRASHINKIVLMQHPIVRTSLIGRVRRAVSIEVSNADINTTLLDALCSDLDRYLQSISHPKKKRAYQVQDLLLKKEVTSNQAALLVNFKMSDNGFVPVLVGENSYKKNTEYLGFKASKETIIRL